DPLFDPGIALKTDIDCAFVAREGEVAVEGNHVVEVKSTVTRQIIDHTKNAVPSVGRLDPPARYPARRPVAITIAVPVPSGTAHDAVSIAVSIAIAIAIAIAVSVSIAGHIGIAVSIIRASGGCQGGQESEKSASSEPR